MKLVIPMAGLGTRMRPHTWARPKPLLPVAGRAMLDHIVDRFRDVSIDEYVFIIGYLGEQTRVHCEITYDIPTTFVLQEKMLGQAHAVWLARDHIKGPIFLMFVDTLFDDVDFSGLAEGSAGYDKALDGVIFTYEADDPRRFGVVETNSEGYATKLIEKPDSVENKTVLMGLYYFRDGEWLVRACGELMERRIQTKGEYYLSDAVTLMIQQGAKFRTREVGVWLDTGKPETTLETHRYLLDHGHDNSHLAPRPGVVVIPPVFVHPKAMVERSVIGPYVSIDKEAHVTDSVLRDVILDEGARVDAALLQESLIGRWTEVRGTFSTLNLGDDSTMVPSDNEVYDEE